MTEREFNRRRENGWDPESPENIPLIQHGESISTLSAEPVVGYHWSEEPIEDVLAIGSTLDMPGEANAYDGTGSRRGLDYGEGVLYAHRDASEAYGLWVWMERGHMYRVTGRAVDRKNVGLTSAGALDQIERIFPVDEVISLDELTLDELASEPTLYSRLMGS